jgi:hypothetical protein
MKANPDCRIEVMSEKSGKPDGATDTWRTTGYWASLYRCGIDFTRMEEVVVTLVSLPARMGWKTERRGSAFWRTVRIWGES